MTDKSAANPGPYAVPHEFTERITKMAFGGESERQSFHDVNCRGCIYEKGYAAGRASLRDVVQWSFEYFMARDEMNAKVHCAPIRLSPITERLRLAIAQDAAETIAEAIRAVDQGDAKA